VTTRRSLVPRSWHPAPPSYPLRRLEDSPRIGTFG